MDTKKKHRIPKKGDQHFFPEGVIGCPDMSEMEFRNITIEIVSHMICNQFVVRVVDIETEYDTELSITWTFTDTDEEYFKSLTLRGKEPVKNIIRGDYG